MKRFVSFVLIPSFWAISSAPICAASQDANETRPALDEDERLTAIREEISSGDRELARSLLHETLEGLGQPEPGGEEAHIQLLLALNGLAEELGSLQDSLELRTSILELRAGLLPPDHPDLLVAKQGLAATKAQLGDLSGARELFEEVLAARTRLLSPDHPDLMKAKANLAAMKYELGDLAGARELEEEVLAAWTQLLPPDHPDLLKAKFSLAATKYELGDISGARELFEEVLAARTRLLPPDHPELLRAKENLAVAKAQLGELVGARELFEEVLATRTRLLPPDHPELLSAKQNLALTRKEVGDVEGARELEEEVLAAWLQLLPSDHPDLLRAKLNLAVTKVALGDLAGARELEEEVLAARTRLLPPDHPDLLKTKQSLSVTRKKLGDLSGAHELEEEVLAAWTQLASHDHPNLLGAKVNLAATKAQLGDLSGARELFEEVLAARTRLLPADHLDLLEAKQGLAVTKALLGDLSGAREIEEEVLAAWTRLLPPDHPNLLEAKLNLAATKTQLGDLAGARELLSSLLGSMRTHAQSLRAESPRAAREGARAELQRFFVVLFLCETADSAGPLRSELFATLESLRQVSIASAEVALALEVRPELAEKQQVIAQKRAQLNDLVASGPAEGEDIQKWEAEIKNAVSERDRLEWELRADLAKAVVFVEVIEPASIAKALSSDAVAISYLRYPRQFPKDPETEEQRPAEDSLLAFVVRPDARVKRVELGPANELEELVTGWRNALGRPVSARGIAVQESSASSEDQANEIGQRLRERILDPLLGLAPEAKVLHIVQDDLLHLVSLDALPLEEGLVGERYAVHNEVSLARLIQPARGNDAAQNMLLAGGIDYDAELTSESDPRLDVATPPVDGQKAGLERSGAIAAGFTRLPATGQEIESIAKLFQECFGTKPLVLEGSAASKATLAEKAKSARFLHLATHGWFAPEVFRSQLDREESETRRRSLLEAEETVKGFAPETLCGLALAGANKGRDAVGRVPGILTAEELSSLDLRSCELAVLSACETNVGIRRAGQGIQSLQAALHAAGVRTAITSLWKVDDAATRRLFELFYTKLWKEKLGKAEALWQAKMALRAEGHPLRDWGGWVLTGAPE